MSWNNPPQTEKPQKDNFWIGFIPSFLMPIVAYAIYIGMNTASMPLMEAMYKYFIFGRLSGSQMLLFLMPSLVLLAVLSALKKEKAMLGTFVGFAPFLILFFWII